MSERKKPIHKVIGINRSDNDLAVYAKQVERALNKLSNDGYSVAIRQEPTGLLVHGELRKMPPTMGSMLDLFDALHGGRQDAAATEEPSAQMSPRTNELLGRFSKEIKPGDHKFAGIAAAAGTATTGFSVEELNEIALELEKTVEVHGKEPMCKGTCGTARFCAAVLDAVKSTARLNLQ
jgi:hypothetical protein